MRRATDDTTLGNGVDDERAWTLDMAARDYIWWYDVRHGIDIQTIANRDGVTHKYVKTAIERARKLERNRPEKEACDDYLASGLDDLGFRLIPLFPIDSFTPESTCPHHHAISEDSRLCCMVCHASGMDGHPGLRRDPETDPTPEPRPTPVLGADRKATRKQRRQQRLAEFALV